LFIIGAGASAGIVDLGIPFLRAPGIDYVVGSRSFPVTIPAHGPLSQRIIRAVRPISLSELFPDRIIRPGSDIVPFQEKLDRMSDSFARTFLKHLLSKPRFSQRPLDAYRTFAYFHPSVLLNYNLDGLATDHCSGIHWVFDAHGTVGHGYGSPLGASLVESVRDFDLEIATDHLIMSVAEPDDDLRLVEQVMRATSFTPDFVALIGYSFARNAEAFDDHISYEIFKRKFHRFRGNVYVIDPFPDSIRDMIADGIESDSVFAVPARWNILSHVFIDFLSGNIGRRSINYVCEQILDRYGDKIVFPILTDPASM
jgi:hypothetical protein